MKRVYSAPNTLMVDHLKHVLDTEGIGCVVRNRDLSGLVGNLPPNECWTELWIIDESEAPQAEAIIETALSSSPVGKFWRCDACGEEVDENFESCWNCSAERGQTQRRANLSPPPQEAIPRPISPESTYWALWILMLIASFVLLWLYAHGR